MAELMYTHYKLEMLSNEKNFITNIYADKQMKCTPFNMSQKFNEYQMR